MENENEFNENDVELAITKNDSEFEVDPDARMGEFVTLSFGLDPDTNMLDVRVAAIPMDLRIIDSFQEKLGEQMAAANMRLVIFNNQAFLAPIKTTNIIAGPGLIIP